MLTAAELDVKEYTVRFCGSAPGVAAAVATPRQCGMGVLHPPRLMSREFRGPGCLHRHRCCQHRGLADGGVRNVPARQAPDVTIPTLFRQHHFDVFLTCVERDGDGDGDSNDDGGDSGGEKLADEKKNMLDNIYFITIYTFLQLNCKNMVTIPGLKRNYTNGMENANKFSVPRQRIHILLREKPQTRKCSVEIGIKHGNTGRLQCEVAREVYTLVLTSTTVSFTSSKMLGVRHESHTIGRNIQIDNRGNAILHRTLIQACKRVDEPRVMLHRTITLRANINCSFESVTYLKNAFLEKCLRQKNISELRD
ncbi:hypothetical protein ALC57_12146 [Trachymyrmex cornetzi]|uniref:Uncharacterized protein n=1 Tax=Trachymyrmex cornetzi TaxID=471704 RepID=A0A195DS18_9HYME|nr:hypothetical protein ALC57_12146 [Trachymyrmex cornetzi]